MTKKLDGAAIVYCEDAFNTTYGKTAHGLVRFTNRYQVVCVVDKGYAGKDAGEVLDGSPTGIPVVASLADGLAYAKQNQITLKHFVIGLAPDGGTLPPHARTAVREAMKKGLHIDSGLHHFLSEDPEFTELASMYDVSIRDIRKPPARSLLHFFSGKIEEVTSLKVAVLGTDSAVGKRTTAWKLVHQLEAMGISTQMIGTGQTAWLQGAKYSLVLDSLVNDFVSGEIEHAVHSAWLNEKPQVIVLEGQGSLMNPAYPGGFELLAAGRPDVVILQHAPARKDYDGFPGYPIQPLPEQIHAIELISGKKVVAITINHEEMTKEEVDAAAIAITKETGLPAFDVFYHGSEGLANVVAQFLKK